MKYTIIGLTLTASLVMSATALALDPRIESMPDPSSVSFYKENAADVDRLVSIVHADGTEEERIAALRDLIDLYPDAAFYAALELVKDPNTAIATMAVDFISASVVMSDHDVHDHDASPAQLYIMSKHEEGKEALRSILLAERAELREKAAQMLASLSDEAALDIINEGVSAGVYSDVEAVNVFAMANSEVGAPLMAAYLDAGSTAAQSSAVVYLGATPEYQELVRNDIFLNPLATASVRTQAAATLSQYDSQFPEYALTVTSDPSVDPSLYAQTIAGYLQSAYGDGNVINPATLKALETGVSNYTVFRDENAPLDIMALDRLEALKGTIRDLAIP